MTCIVGVRHEGKVYLGGDGQDTAGKALIKLPSPPKVWVVGEYAIGHSGDGHACQVMKHAFKPSPPAAKSDLLDHMVLRFVPEMRKALTEYGLQLTGDEAVCVTAIIGLRGHLFEMDTDWCVYEHTEYATTGSGHAWAAGSLRETKKLAPRTRVQRALLAAAQHCAGVGPPFTFVSV